MAHHVQSSGRQGFLARLRGWLVGPGGSEADRLSPRLLAETARDLNISPQELERRRVENPRAAELMPARLAASGIDPGYVRAAEPAVYRDLERTCSHCGSAKRCAHDLAAGDIESGQRDYCLNAGTIDALGLDQSAAKCCDK